MSHFEVKASCSPPLFNPFVLGEASYLFPWGLGRFHRSRTEHPIPEDGQSGASHPLWDIARTSNLGLSLATSRGLEPCQRSILIHAATVPESIGSLAQRNGMPLLLHRGTLSISASANAPDSRDSRTSMAIRHDLEGFGRARQTRSLVSVAQCSCSAITLRSLT